MTKSRREGTDSCGGGGCRQQWRRKGTTTGRGRMFIYMLGVRTYVHAYKRRCAKQKSSTEAYSTCVARTAFRDELAREVHVNLRNSQPCPPDESVLLPGLDAGSASLRFPIGRAIVQLQQNATRRFRARWSKLRIRQFLCSRSCILHGLGMPGVAGCVPR